MQTKVKPDGTLDLSVKLFSRWEAEFLRERTGLTEHLPSTDQRRQEVLCASSSLLPIPLTIPLKRSRRCSPGARGGVTLLAPEWETGELALHHGPGTSSLSLPLLPQPGLPQPHWRASPGLGDSRLPSPSCMKAFPGPQAWRMIAGSPNRREAHLWVVCLSQTRRGTRASACHPTHALTGLMSHRTTQGSSPRKCFAGELVFCPLRESFFPPFLFLQISF